MGGLREIPRTATFTWSPDASAQTLVTGTKAGAVDEGFSNETQLELWDLSVDKTPQSNEPQPIASVSTDSRFNDIAWTKSQTANSKGVIAGALESGVLELWDAARLETSDTNSLVAQSSKHGGAIKALQFNAYKSELLATVGVKGELFISDINNVESPFRVGNTVARADDFDCLDWNKRTSHILATGSSGGIVTVWDIKNKRESLSLNKLGRKPVSAVAWDPVKATGLLTATSSDSDPLILSWDLRNPNAPEQILKGHEAGILSLAWCQQDSDLLLSCGKDNRTICWNPRTGGILGEFPIVTNWTFQTRWNPQNPNFIATASFDGKISVEPIQNLASDPASQSRVSNQIYDEEDFFSKAQAQSHGTTFSLSKAPAWLQRPCGASFAFGGKIASFKLNSTDPKKRSTIRISAFAIDDTIASSAESFHVSLKEGKIDEICDTKAAAAEGDNDKADWKVIKILNSQDTKQGLLDYLNLGVTSNDSETVAGSTNEQSQSRPDEQQSDTADTKSQKTTNEHRLSGFFDTDRDDNSFPLDSTSAPGANMNDPFHIFGNSASESDKLITNALLLGQFDSALDLCISERRISDAFMIAICGGPQCIEKAQKAYFRYGQQGSNYVRLLKSIVDKDLWDLVHNADLSNWKEILASVCTYAKASEFPELCETLGDRLDEQSQAQEAMTASREHATLCFLAGSKLEKVVGIWLQDLARKEVAEVNQQSQQSGFTIHARLLQEFIEKVTLFREATHYSDEQQDSSSNWKLASLYDRYIEYADIASAHGQLEVAERYLGLLPNQYAAANVAKSRIQRATSKKTSQPVPHESRHPGRAQQRSLGGLHAGQAQHSGLANQVAPAPVPPYAPSSAQQNPYAPQSSQIGSGGVANAGFQTPSQRGVPYGYGAQPPNGAPIAPPRAVNASPAVPSSKLQNVGNWNDMPDSFFKAPTTSRRGTPGLNNDSSLQVSQSALPPTHQAMAPTRSTPPLGPPPKAGVGPPRVVSPPANPQAYGQQVERPTSAANPYAPSATSLPVQSQSTIPRGPSPYNAPPSGAPSTNRYAPSQAGSSRLATTDRSEGIRTSHYAPTQHSATFAGPPPQSQGPTASAPPKGTANAPEPPQGPHKAPEPLDSQTTNRSSAAKHRASGDRSHISEAAQPIHQILSSEMQRVKSRAPASFKAQVENTEKRLNILFDHLNNDDLLKADTVSSMVELAQAVQARDYETAQAIHLDILTNKNDQCGNWMVGVKRVIAMSRATP